MLEQEPIRPNRWYQLNGGESIRVGLIRNNKPNFVHFSSFFGAESTWQVAMKVLYMMPVDYRSYLVGSAFERIYNNILSIGRASVFVMMPCCCFWGLRELVVAESSAPQKCETL